MVQTLDRDDGISGADAAFADPAFDPLKARAAPFAILRLPTDRMDGADKVDGAAGPAGEVLWANAAAAAFWGADTADDTASALALALLGGGGRGGWLDGLARGLVPDRPPRLARAGLGRGFRMRAHTALIRAWTDCGGATLIGLAVPDAAPGAEADPVGDAAAWRRPAWTNAGSAVEATPQRGDADPPTDDADGGVPPHAPADGLALARRGQLAVLRDRLGRAIDGAAALRLLWRTDEAGAVASIDAEALARMGSPLRFDGRAMADAVAPFDAEGAGRLRAALAARATFAGLTVGLPVADAAAILPMAISGSPVFGPERRFAGFRGFGTLDLGRLALADRPAPAGSSDGLVAGQTSRAESVPGGEAHGREPDEPVPPTEPAPPAAVAQAELPAEMPPALSPKLLEDASPAEPRLAANVVHLRAFQDMAAGRFAALPAPPAPPAPPAVAPPAEVPAAVPAAVPAGEAGDGATAPGGDGPAPEGGPLSDQLAFLALGEALRARIGAPPAAAEPPAAPSPAGLLAAPPDAAPPDAAPPTVGDALADADPAADRTALQAAPWLLAEPDGHGVADGSAHGSADGRAGAAERAGDHAVELLDRVDDAVALLDGAGRLRRLNRRGEGWFGSHDPRDAAEGEAAPGRSLADLLVPESRSVALALLDEVRDRRDGLGAPPLRREVAARTAEGAVLPMLLTLGRLGASGFYATLRDVSASPAAAAGAPRAEAERPGRDPAPDRAPEPARDAGWLPDLLAKVSHEIRTPLGAIQGFAEVMMDERFGPLGNPRYKDYMRDIHAAGAQVVALVEDLLDLSRIEAGRFDLDVAAVDINRVVTEAVAQMQPEAHRERVIMRTSLAGRVSSALVDERSARQIVKNLLSNAIKFNEPGGQVIVSTAPGEGGGVLLRVRDTGVGMSDEAIAAAMEPFGGLSARGLGGAAGGVMAGGAGGGAGGNGLGLPLTRALVGANGASMTIRSRPREGTLVEVSFAAAEQDGARRPA